MGAYTPLDWLEGYTETHGGVARNFTEIVVDRVARPTVEEMARRGTPFVGVLYCGLAITSRGVRVVEFNARFGDPEIQAVLERLATPLGGLLLDAATGQLGTDRQLEWSNGYAADVVIAAENYPEAPAREMSSQASQTLKHSMEWRSSTPAPLNTMETSSPPGTRPRCGRHRRHAPRSSRPRLRRCELY